MKKIPYYLSLPALYAVAILPFPLLYLLSDFLRFILFDLLGYRKAVIDTNLRNSFPEKTEAEIQAIAKEFKKNLSDTIVESIKMLTLTKKQLRQRNHVENPEVIAEQFKKNKLVLIVVGHTCTWEWGSLIQSEIFKEPTLVVYKTLQDPLFDRFVFDMRSRFGTIMIPMDKIGRKVIEYRKKASSLVIAGDQFAGRGSQSTLLNFLNQETYVYLGAERMARMLDSTVLFCNIRRTGRGMFSYRFTLLTEEPKSLPEGEITRLHTEVLEQSIRKEPASWLWSHKRWK